MTSPFVTLAHGIGMTEGPLWASSHRLFVTSVSRGAVFEVPLDGSGATAVLSTGGSPSGLAENGGRRWIAQAGHETRNPEIAHLRPPASIQRWEGTSASVEVQGDLSAPNDLTFGPDGRLWFTDPAGDPFGARVPPGRLWAYTPESGRLELISDTLQFPNGLAFGPSGALVVSETSSRRLVRFECDGTRWVGPTPFAELAEGSPDGMAFDREGRIHVAATRAGAVLVFDQHGEEVERIDLDGSFATNCAFAGPDLQTLVVTVADGGRVLAVPRDTPGLPLADRATQPQGEGS